MKALIVLVILATLGLIVYNYNKDKNLKKLLISLVTFGVIFTLGVLGNMTRPVMPLFISHILLMLISWGTLIVYMVRGKYYWWLLFSPVVTIGLFLLLELVTGSAHEVG